MPETIEATEPTVPSLRDALKMGAESDPNNPHKEESTPKESPQAPPPKSPEKPTPPATPPTEPEGFLPDDEERAEGKKPATGKDFRRVKTFATKKEQEAKEYRAKVETYEKELEELRKRPATNAEEIQKIQAERDQYKNTVETLFVEGDANFNKGYADRISQVNDGLKGQIPPEVHAKASQLFNLPDSEYKTRQLDELVSDLSPVQQMKVMRADERIQELLSDRQSKVNNAHQTREQLVASRQKEQQEQQAIREKTFERVYGKVSKENPMFQKREGDEEWNSGVDERLHVAREVYRGGLNPDELAEWALSAASIKALAGESKRDKARISELEAVVTKMQGAGPDVDGSGGKGGDSNSPKKGFFELIGDASKEG